VVEEVARRDRLDKIVRHVPLKEVDADFGRW
jgi:hypothetical protein